MMISKNLILIKNTKNIKHKNIKNNNLYKEIKAKTLLLHKA